MEKLNSNSRGNTMGFDVTIQFLDECFFRHLS
uniref:Uncharacterized protein n=1 Tax=Arundo donax TaxID=35708 RepID=A0A0A9C7K4_ARUDO